MTMTIGDAATTVGVSAKAVRLWESKGLLRPAERTDAGYRLYDEEDLRELRFIRQAKALDLTLEEIREVLDLQRQGAVPCGRVTSLLDAHIAQIDDTIRELTGLRQVLDRARRSADERHQRGEQTVICRIIESVPLDGTDEGEDLDRLPAVAMRGRATPAGAV